MILIGNSFPLSLVARPCMVEPASVEELRAKAQVEGWRSFWGHDNTRAAVAEILGFDPAPAAPRPVLMLGKDDLPELDGESFSEVWVLSPRYRTALRPAIGKEIALDEIKSWQCLKIRFDVKTTCITK